MTFRDDERGQAVVLGAILLFALFILALSIYQVNLVPQQNRQAEFGAYQVATGSMSDLHDGLVGAAALGGRGSVTVETGAQYPVRVIGMNPGPVTGTVSTEPAGHVTVTNAVAVDETARAYWNGDTRGGAGTDTAYATDRIVFSPAYNELDAASVATDGVLTYRIADDGELLPLTQQTLVRGTHVSLTLVDGAVDIAAADVPLVIEPISSNRDSLLVTGRDTDGDADVDEDDDGILIAVPSQLPADVWSTEILDDEPNVVGVTQADGAVIVELRAADATGPITYRLDIALVEVRQRGDDSTAAEGRPAHVVRAGGHNAVVTSDQTQDVTVQVRDQYDNPRPGVDVVFQVDGTEGALVASGDTAQTSITVRTGEAGRATASFVPDRAFSGTATVSATCGACLAGSQTVDTDVQVGSTRVPNRPPGIEVIDVSRSTDGSNRDVFYVVARATDPDSDTDNDLQSIDFTLRDPAVADSGSNHDFVSQPISGQDASATKSLTAYSGNRDQYRIIATVTDGAGARASDSFVLDGASGGSGPAPLSITNVGITDETNSGKARYSVDVEVQQASDFGRVELELENLDTGRVTTTAETDQRTTYTLTADGTGNSEGDDFLLTVRVYDNTGSVVDDHTTTDTADSNNP